VKELKASISVWLIIIHYVESGEGIESYFHFAGSLTVMTQWNPVKELKEVKAREWIALMHISVESGEGIERISIRQMYSKRH